MFRCAFYPVECVGPIARVGTIVLGGSPGLVWARPFTPAAQITVLVSIVPPSLKSEPMPPS
jgi:hypothetical protein